MSPAYVDMYSSKCRATNRLKATEQYISTCTSISPYTEQMHTIEFGGGRCWDLDWNLMLSRQALSNLCMTTALFVLVIFHIGSLIFCQVTLRLQSFYRHVPPCLDYWLRWCLAKFFLDCPWTAVFPMSTSQVAGITGINHCAWPVIKT
jgi:hypothetical protein